MTAIVCSGKTKDGNPCKGRAMKEKTLCPIHYKASIGEPVRRKNVKSPRKAKIDIPKFMDDGAESSTQPPKSPKIKKSVFSVSVNMETPKEEPKKAEEEKIVFAPKSPRKRTVKSLSEKRRLMSPRRHKIGRDPF